MNEVNRVQGLDSLIGHEAAREWLGRMIREDRLPHGLLIAGPRGVGKRTLVRAVVAAFFCESRSGCGACASCEALERDHQVGWHRVHAAEGKSTIGIDQVRSLEQTLSIRAAHARGRVTSVEQADQLSPGAQDAFLKTLEEPPPGNVLLLTTSRIDALLPTIRSRCQTLTLGPLNTEELQQVAERLGLQPRVPWALAQGCPGLLARLCEEGAEELRRGVLWVLQSPRGPQDASRWNLVLRKGLPAKPEREVLRERARWILQVLSSLARDLAILRAVPGDPNIDNEDWKEPLTELAGQAPWADPAGLLRRLAEARRWIDGSVDPAAALTTVLFPPERSLSLLAGFEVP